MINPPKLTYSGLTVIVDNPSRFDTRGKLIDAQAGIAFDKSLLPLTNRFQIEIRTADEQRPLQPNTKGLLLLGQRATDAYLGEGSRLNNIRGTPSLSKRAGLYCIPSYFPQNAKDPVDHEGRFNPQVNNNTGEVEDSDETTEKRHKVISRSNWSFFLDKDIRKAVELVKLHNGVPPKEEFIYELCPSIDHVCNLLLTTVNDYIYLDIETDKEHNCYCIGFATSTSPVYVLPILGYDYSPIYPNWYRLLSSLSIALSRNTAVLHNASFDLLVLAHKYHIPFGRKIHDTMVMFHRIYPEAEKALAQVGSLFSWEEYHKDDGVFMPMNYSQQESLWKYNARDVFLTRIIHRNMLAYAEKDPGLLASMMQGCRQLYAFLTNSLVGIRYDMKEVSRIMERNDLAMTQYLRVLKLLVGQPFLPTSIVDTTKYYGELMGYKSPIRSKTSGKPSWNEEALRKLLVTHPQNLTILYSLLYRAKKKESGSLKFIPWKNYAELTIESTIT